MEVFKVLHPVVAVFFPFQAQQTPHNFCRRLNPASLPGRGSSLPFCPCERPLCRLGAHLRGALACNWTLDGEIFGAAGPPHPGNQAPLSPCPLTVCPAALSSSANPPSIPLRCGTARETGCCFVLAVWLCCWWPASYGAPTLSPILLFSLFFFFFDLSCREGTPV